MKQLTKLKKLLTEHKKIPAILIPFVAFIALFVLYFNKPGASKILPPCLFKLITGLYCPGCGSTRMLYSIIHLDFLTALRCNILAFLLILFLMYTYLVYVLKIFFPSKKILPDICRYTVFSRTIIIVTCLFWILRNIPIFPFNLLAPVNLI